MCWRDLKSWEINSFVSLLTAQKGAKSVYTQTPLKQSYSSFMLSEISVFVFEEILFDHLNHKCVQMCTSAAHERPSIQLMGAGAFLYFAF